MRYVFQHMVGIKKMTLNSGVFPVVVLTLLLVLFAYSPLTASEKEFDTEMVIGNTDAPVTIIEYASMTCGHCSTFHGGNYKKLKEKYINTGKVRFIFREFPLDGLALRAAMIARCSDTTNFFGMIETMFATQEKWLRATDPLAALKKLARLGGMSSKIINACLENEKLMDDILKTRLDGNKLHNIQSTPSFVIGNTTYPGDRNWNDWESILKERLR